MVGTKRQVTMPVRLLELLSIDVGSQFQIEVDGDDFG
jgi:bifunctional DNA-binding transcriptional regulator/antitoxin component of YhaV-PrlF toxin-antitoxin module